MTCHEQADVILSPMKKKKINIDSTEPINSIAEVDGVVDASHSGTGPCLVERMKDDV